MGRWEPHPVRNERAILRKLYVDIGLSLCEIGKLVNRDPKTVQGWFHSLGIPTRNKNEAMILAHEKYRHPWLGKKFSKEHREKISKGNVGKKHSWQIKEKLRRERIGNQWTGWKGGIDRVTSYRIWGEFWRENIPEGYILHHVDGNYKNNDLCNLALVTRSLHNRIHNTVQYLRRLWT